jgi:hypothetical protein
MLSLPMTAILTIGRVTFQRQVASTFGSCSETQEGFRLSVSLRQPALRGPPLERWEASRAARVRLPQHPDQHPPERPVLLAVDQ